MRLPHIALVALPTVCAACLTFGALQSQTFIAANRTFLLGGDQTRAFTIEGRNSGRVAIVVYAERNGRRDGVTTLQPGNALDAEFPAHSVAVFRNTSAVEQAVITLTARGATSNLGMRYEVNRR